MLKENKKYISVFIPTYNGEKYIASTLEALINQKLPQNYIIEILITDSGSKDKTLDILRTYKDYIILNIIPNKDYGHGKTRQRAAEMAKGEFILYLTQDATPTSQNWLLDMLEPFYLSDTIGCVFGKQIPRPDVAATIKREVSEVFNQFGPENAIMVHRKRSLIDSSTILNYNYFLSDVNAAYRRSLIIESFPFRDLNYAEDQAIAEDILNGNMLKAYSPKGAVWHSNEYSAKNYYHRKFDEYTGLIDTKVAKLVASKKELLIGWLKPTIKDWRFILKDKDYTFLSKIYWLAISPIYNINNFRGKYQAIINYHNVINREKLSLEAKSKK